MDILSKRILEVGDSCHFLRASATYPTAYLRFKGVIKERRSSDDRIYYYIQITDVLEGMEIVKDYIHQTHWRIKIHDAKYRLLREFKIMDLLIRKYFKNAFCNRYKNSWMEVPMVLVYESEKEMQEALSKINDHLVTKIESDMEVLQRVAYRK